MFSFQNATIPLLKCFYSSGGVRRFRYLRKFLIMYGTVELSEENHGFHMRLRNIWIMYGTSIVELSKGNHVFHSLDTKVFHSTKIFNKLKYFNSVNSFKTFYPNILYS